ncbi:uncharacterized protein EDB91DRAFT_1254481 [Suillus paluster]|uniref:uncharacterized protein n=1 Tax=Suillus paluster TaxID=48578 RepID=UPI001B88738B|nr:uncharacterized protein EDB91DRAFT_1254481 [Suillus paluster]KAG1726061.1 hypothetical protein EDB91DRAFT_1254481 [Suillus paluster]
MSGLDELDIAKHLVLHDPIYDPYGKDRFSLSNHRGPNTYLLSDKHNLDDYIIYYEQMIDPDFDTAAWLTDLKLRNYRDLMRTASSSKASWTGLTVKEQCSPAPMDCNIDDTLSDRQPNPPFNAEDDLPVLLDSELSDDESHRDTESLDDEEPPVVESLYCGGSSNKQSDLPDLRTLQQQAARLKMTSRILPRSIVIIVLVNARPCRALLDSGSLTDFISTTIVDQLKLKYDVLEKPIPLQLTCLRLT